MENWELLQQCIVDDDADACAKLAVPITCGFAAVALSLYLLNHSDKLFQKTKSELKEQSLKSSRERIGTVHLSQKQQGSFVMVVTGANKGIGFQICRRAVRVMQESTANRERVLILTSRNKEQGVAACNALKPSTSGNDISVIYHQLDISDASSVDSFCAWVRKTYGGVNCLVNNAGFAHFNSSCNHDSLVNENASGSLLESLQCMRVNYRGTKALTLGLLPLLHPFARVVNVSSSVGQLSPDGDGRCPLAVSADSGDFGFSPERMERLQASDLTLEELDQFADEFEAALQERHSGGGDGTCGAKRSGLGWPLSAYGVSKTFVTQLTRVLATTTPAAGAPAASEQERPLFVACCPGLCRTDMVMRPRIRAAGASKGYLPWAVECAGALSFLLVQLVFGASAWQGADTPTWLAMDGLEEAWRGEFQGRFVRKREVAGY